MEAGEDEMSNWIGQFLTNILLLIVAGSVYLDLFGKDFPVNSMLFGLSVAIVIIINLFSLGNVIDKQLKQKQEQTKVEK